MLDAVKKFLLNTGGPVKPLDTTGGTLRFCGTPVKKHCWIDSIEYEWPVYSSCLCRCLVYLSVKGWYFSRSVDDIECKRLILFVLCRCLIAVNENSQYILIVICRCLMALNKNGWYILFLLCRHLMALNKNGWYILFVLCRHLVALNKNGWYILFMLCRRLMALSVNGQYSSST